MGGAYSIMVQSNMPSSLPTTINEDEKLNIEEDE